MQKYTKIAVNTLILSSVIFLLFISSGCGKKSVSEPEGLVEILRISSDCSTDNSTVDKCCLDQCSAFCEENNYRYAKHVPNVHSCGCWCD